MSIRVQKRLFGTFTTSSLQLVFCTCLGVLHLALSVDAESLLHTVGSGISVGHHPDLATCHSNCEAANACGVNGICLCHCCSDGSNNDGCFCYSCAPLGLPVSVFSGHEKYSLVEPRECKGSKQMCGGMFGSVKALDNRRNEITASRETINGFKLKKESMRETVKRTSQLEKDQPSNMPYPGYTNANIAVQKQIKRLQNCFTYSEKLEMQRKQNVLTLKNLSRAQTLLRVKIATYEKNLLNSKKLVSSMKEKQSIHDYKLFLKKTVAGGA
jgi:hypothetical protein